jgi:uncharacterized membrane protein
MIADIVTELTTQATAVSAGVVDVIGVVLPIAIGMLLFYFGWRKLRGAVK